MERPVWTPFWAWLFISVIIALVIILVVLVVFVIIFSVRSSLVGTETEGFSLYKNSRFEECAAQNEDNHLNCTSIVGSDFNTTQVEISRFGYLSESDTHSWCEFVGCLKDYQVVPSVPAPEAATSSILFMCVGIVLATIFVFYALVKQYNFEPHEGERCPESGIGIWLGVVASFCTMIWWWVSVAQIRGSPLAANDVSHINWATTWAAAQTFQHHPISCQFFGKPTQQKIIWIGLLVMAAAQLGVSSYILWLSHTHFPSAPFYEFREEEFASSPGGPSTCSATEVGSLSHLFQYHVLGETVGIEYNRMFLRAFEFSGFLLGLIIDACYFLPAIAKGPFAHRASLRRHGLVNRGFVWSGGLAVTCVLATYIAMRTSIFYLKHADREAPLVMDHSCRVVHVGLSGWRHYLDLQDHSRGTKIVKGLFNIGF